MVHLCDCLPSSAAFCIPRCNKSVQWQTACGDVALPVTCLGCLAEDPSPFVGKDA